MFNSTYGQIIGSLFFAVIFTVIADARGDQRHFNLGMFAIAAAVLVFIVKIIVEIRKK